MSSLSGLGTEIAAEMAMASLPESTPTIKQSDGAPPLGGGASRVRRAHNTSKKKANTRKAGVRQKIRTFEKFWETEGELASYLGYQDVAHLRRFAISPYCLWFYNLVQSDRAAVRRFKILNTIRDCANELMTDDNPNDVYPERDGTEGYKKTWANYRWALAVLQMQRSIVKGLSGSPPFTQEDVMSTQQDLRESSGREIPHIQLDAVKFPELGPRVQQGESDLEPANRCINLLNYVTYCCNNTVWRQRYGTQDWDASRYTSGNHILQWLRHPKPAIEVKVVWRFASKTGPPREYQEYAEEQEYVDIMTSSQQTVSLEPEATRAQLRDTIRAVFLMNTIEAQIHSLRLVLEAEGDDDDEIHFNVNTGDWQEAKELLWMKPERKSAFYLTVRRIEEREELWEKEEPPLELQRLPTVENGDIVSTKRHVAAPETSNFLVEEPSTDETIAQQNIEGKELLDKAIVNVPDYGQSTNRETSAGAQDRPGKGKETKTDVEMADAEGGRDRPSGLGIGQDTWSNRPSTSPFSEFGNDSRDDENQQDVTMEEEEDEDASV